MTSEKIEKSYFKWMCQLVSDKGQEVEYDKLLYFLSSIEFTYSNPMDRNRYGDGLSLRYRFAYDKHFDSEEIRLVLDEPCSVLEMMVALALRCEEDIACSTEGDRTCVWFWKMIESLGLIDMTNEYFDIDEAELIIFRFLDRDYDRTGHGGLFTVHGAPYDMRDAEIWMQMNWYMNSIL